MTIQHVTRCVLLLLLLGAACSPPEASQLSGDGPINAVLGDISFVEAYGRLPDANTSEQVRIETHLHYIERHLRAHPPEHLTEAQRARREAALDALHAYHSEDGFPISDGHPDARRPTFISDNGHVCAVGALLERELVEDLNREHKHAYLHEIDDPRLASWAERHGFTEAELARVQPTYDSAPESRFCRCAPEAFDAPVTSPGGLSYGEGARAEFRGAFALRPERVQGYRVAVEGALKAQRARLAACLEGAAAPVTVDFRVSYSGEAFRVSSDASKRSGCVARAMQAVRYPPSCELPSRALRVVLHPGPEPVGAVTYRITPGPTRHASCEVAAGFGEVAP